MLTLDLAELLERRVNAGDVSAATGFELVDYIYAINQASAYKKKIEYYQQLKEEGDVEVDSTWLKTYDSIPVVFNDVLGLYQSELPEEPLALPRGRGIQVICPMQSPETPFMYQTEGEVWMFTNLPSDYTSYWFANKTISYKNINPDVTTVKITFVPMFSDEIQDDMAFEIIELAFTQFLKGKGIQQQKLDNNNPNKPEINEPRAAQ